ncbi:uncharacterized protein [Chelonus insularis]|uniref:uncharacterized protein isoform X1 n=1 Tax=Chelonus insularis TaxID=460826 RepID=UPI00158F3CBB|nr:uncharacterized protein LOC118069144 isoform X1 [Chelonus insularis]
MCENNYRDKDGRFCKSNKRKWRENIAAANSKRQKMNKKYFEGGRVIDIVRLGEDMWCNACHIPLSMQFIKEECLRGLASVFRIKCFKCDIIYSVKTSKQDSDDGTYHINGLLALAIYDAGIGLAEINQILTILNIPPVHQQLLKRNERRVGIAIEKVAKASCIEALKLEKAMTIQDRLNHEESTLIIDLDGGRTNDEDTNCIIDINNDKEISDDIKNNNKITYNTEINNNDEINNKFKNNNKITFNMEINNNKEIIDIEEINNNKIIINNEQINSNNSDIINNKENSKHVNPDIISFSEISEGRRKNKSEEKKPKLKQWRVLKKNVELKESKLKSKIELFDLPKTCDARKALEMLDVNTLATNGEVGCAFGLDAGWQKSGRAHNSRTGHCTAIGRNSNLYVSYDVCTTECRLCARGVSRDQHDCRVNHSGSAKSMEPAMAERMLIENLDFQVEGVKTTIFIGDDDSSTIGCLRRKSNHPFTKLCDKNHAITKVTSALYGLKLPTMVIDYLKYLFKCAIENNNGDVEVTRKAILTIVPHSFGDHLECGAWCKYKDNPEKYQHNRLPKGKPLTGEQLKASLTSLFKRQAAKAEELAPGASTQANESLNQMIARHHPKNKFYGASSSIHARIGAAISQKNIGTTYVDVVKKELSYSPSTTRAKKYRSSLDERRKNHAITSQSTVGKNGDVHYLKNVVKKIMSLKERKVFPTSPIVE